MQIEKTRRELVELWIQVPRLARTYHYSIPHVEIVEVIVRGRDN